MSRRHDLVRYLGAALRHSRRTVSRMQAAIVHGAPRGDAGHVQAWSHAVESLAERQGRLEKIIAAQSQSIDDQFRTISAFQDDVSATIEGLSGERERHITALDEVDRKIQELGNRDVMVRQQLDDLLKGLKNVSHEYGQRLDALDKIVLALPNQSSQTAQQTQIARLDTALAEMREAWVAGLIRLAVAETALRGARRSEAQDENFAATIPAESKPDEYREIVASTKTSLEAMAKGFGRGDRRARQTLDRFADDFARFMIERDNLLNARDRYLQDIQALSRKGAITSNADGIHLPRPALPEGIVEDSAHPSGGI